MKPERGATHDLSRVRALYDAMASFPPPPNEDPLDPWEDIPEEVKMLMAAAIDKAFPVASEIELQYPRGDDVGCVTLPSGERWAVAGKVARYVESLKNAAPQVGHHADARATSGMAARDPVTTGEAAVNDRPAAAPIPSAARAIAGSPKELWLAKGNLSGQWEHHALREPTVPGWQRYVRDDLSSAPSSARATRADFIQVNDTLDVAECCVHDQIKNPHEREEIQKGLQRIRDLALSALRGTAPAARATAAMHACEGLDTADLQGNEKGWLAGLVNDVHRIEQKNNSLLDAVCVGNKGCDLKARCQSYEASEQAHPCPAGRCVMAEESPVSEVEVRSDKNQCVYLCRASGEGSHDFRVCADRAAVLAFYEEMCGKDQDGTVNSLTSAFDDPDQWSNEGTALEIELYCAKFEVWIVDREQISTGARSAIARHWVYAAAEAHRDLVLSLKDDHCTGTTMGGGHLLWMLDQIRDAGFSPTKACRWLGWVQAMLNVRGVANLERLKAINLEASRRADSRGEGNG